MADTGPEPSVAGSIERLVAASQGMITKRIDLALLEVQDIVTRLLVAVVLGGCGVVLACAAWFALSAAIVWGFFGEASPAVRAAGLAVLNAVGAALVVAPASRLARTRVKTHESAVNGRQRDGESTEETDRG